jgi:hydrogenase maturation protein HypF
MEKVYHHHAHASALVGENMGEERWMVFTWDGTGMGEDGSLWGGEVLTGRPGAWSRTGSFRPFHLPGGERASREPWRSAVALCWETDIAWPDCPEHTELLYQAWQRRLNCPTTSAVGRLFDAAAALTGLLHRASYEGQGPMMLEAAAQDREMIGTTRLPIEQDALGLWRIDWYPLLSGLMDGSRSIQQRAAAFHGGMARAIFDQARLLREQQAIERVGLCGGVFQNRLLCEHAARLLENDGFKVRLSEKLPCNDGGLSFGQIIEYGARTPERPSSAKQ